MNWCINIAPVVNQYGDQKSIKVLKYIIEGLSYLESKKGTRKPTEPSEPNKEEKKKEHLQKQPWLFPPFILRKALTDSMARIYSASYSSLPSQAAQEIAYHDIERTYKSYFESSVKTKRPPSYKSKDGFHRVVWKKKCY